MTTEQETKMIVENVTQLSLKIDNLSAEIKEQNNELRKDIEKVNNRIDKVEVVLEKIEAVLEQQSKAFTEVTNSINARLVTLENRTNFQNTWFLTILTLLVGACITVLVKTAFF